MDAKRIIDQMRSVARLAVIATAALAGAGCDQHVNLGSIGDGSASLLWKATFEPGDLSEWTGDGQGGTFKENEAAAPAVVATPVHRGSKAGVLAIAPAASMLSINYLFRNQVTAPAAYYSAWFFVPSTLVVGSYLSLIHFRGLAADKKTVIAIWDVNLTPLGDGTVAAQLFDYVRSIDTPPPMNVRFPFDRWVQLEVYFSEATDATGRIAIWQDGTLILDHPGVMTVTTPDWLQWQVGAASTDLSVTKLPAQVYIDDAAISLTPLGPDAQF